jgi:hypothetical protein
MKLYVERMIKERDDLKGRIKKAKAALENNPFDMTETGKELLTEQVKSMESYLAILNQRIEYESGGEIRA